MGNRSKGSGSLIQGQSGGGLWFEVQKSRCQDTRRWEDYAVGVCLVSGHARSHPGWGANWTGRLGQSHDRGFHDEAFGSTELTHRGHIHIGTETPPTERGRPDIRRHQWQ